MIDEKNLEKNWNINWEKVDYLIPAIIQDNNTQQVLMMGYMNPEALEKTMQEKVVWFFSRTKQRLWKKGETSKNILSVKNISLDCDNDTLLIQAIPAGPTCHLGTVSCFDEKNIFKLSHIFSLLEQRKKNLPENSYSTLMFRKGNNFIAGKITEEADEVSEEVKDISSEKINKQRIIEESCDVLFHLFALNVHNNISLDEIEKELELRNSDEYLHKSNMKK